MIKLEILDVEFQVKASSEDLQLASLIYYDGYEDGDYIRITLSDYPAFYDVKIDETIETAHVYMTEKEWIYRIDFSKRGKTLHPNAFDDTTHYLCIKKAECHHHILMNPLDQDDYCGMYPHVIANVETAGNPAFSCHNVIDGIYANTRHARYPFTSWGIAGRNDARLKVLFGRTIDIESITFYLRAQFPHDSYWVQGTVSFDGKKEYVLDFKKTKNGQVFKFQEQAQYIELYDLVKANDDSLYPSLSLIEIKETQKGENYETS